MNIPSSKRIRKTEMEEHVLTSFSSDYHAHHSMAGLILGPKVGKPPVSLIG
jgi:hypothetical protein